jgi:hypothetical protein
MAPIVADLFLGGLSAVKPPAAKAAHRRAAASVEARG